MPKFNDKSPAELEKLIADAQLQLENLQKEKRKDVLAQIKELAASIGVTAIVTEAKSTGRKVSASVPVKYRNPEKHEETWTGRGVTPKWLQALIAAGKQKEDFLIK